MSLEISIHSYQYNYEVLNNWCYLSFFPQINRCNSTRSTHSNNSSAWYVLRVKNMHFVLPSDSWDPCSKAKLSYVHYIIRQGEAELGILELTSVFHHLPIANPKQLCALAHLDCTCKAGTYLLFFNKSLFPVF